MRCWIVSALVTLAACSSTSRVAGVSCGSDGDCALGDVSGHCESTGYCSYPDPTCTGGRYSPAAGNNLGNTCVGGAAACGAKDQACCAGDLCGSDLACDMASATCACGAADQPCCSGTTCGANLACLADSTCACGAIGDPCCGGTTCNGGLSCTAGTCGGGVVDFAVAEGHVCAVRPDHTVSCWGFDTKPYSFDVPGMTTPVIASSTPFTIPNLTDVAQIRAGAKHTCARKTDSTLWCWGHNENGQLGDGTTTSSLAAVQVAGLTNVTLFDAAKLHTCATGTYGGASGLWCWGHGTQGTHRAGGMRINATMSRLGNNDISDQPRPVRVDLTAATSGGQTIKSLSTGIHHSCVAMSDKTVWCWGANDQGQLGTGTTTPTKVPVPANLAGVTIPAGVTVEEVSCDKNRGSGTCLRLTNGGVYCWGRDTMGELGDGTTSATARTAPTTIVSGGITFAQLAAGSETRCGRDSTGGVWCWGSGNVGALGDGRTTGALSAVPVQVMGLTGATRIDMFTRTACALDGASHLFCWGNNRHHQLTTALPPVVVQAMEVTP